MSAFENAEVVRRGYEAFARGDMGRLRELFAPDIRWHVNGRNRQAGTFEGIDAVLGSFGQLAAESGGTFGVDIHDMLASEDHVVVLARLSAQRGGELLEGNYCHVFHVRGDRVTEAWIVNEDPYAGDRFWG